MYALGLAVWGLTASIAQAETWQGRSLADLLESLRKDGLRLVYSSLVVPPDLMLKEEVPFGSPTEMLESALAASGLRAELREGGRLVVVRARRPPAAPALIAGVVVRDSIVVKPLAPIAACVSLEGRPVRGLEAEDFRLRVGGSERIVSSVDVVETAGRAAVDGPGVPETDRRLWILLLDRGGGGPDAWRRAQQTAEILTERLGPKGRLALVVYSVDSVRMASPEAVSRQAFAETLPEYMERTSLTYLLHFQLSDERANSRSRRVRVAVPSLGRKVRVEVWPREMPGG